MQQAAAMVAQERCACGSGLAARRCCKLAELRIEPESTLQILAPVLAQANAALEKNDNAAAERLCHQILDLAPGHVDGLLLLYRIKKAAGVEAAAEALLRRAVRVNPNHAWATDELAMLLYLKGNRLEAEVHARNAIRLGPGNAQAHNMMGMIFTETNRALAGERHYRRALELLPQPIGKLCANLALNLMNQGKLEESEKFYREAVRLEPDNVATLLGWVKMEESRRNFDRALELLHEAARLKPEAPEVRFQRAVLYNRTKAYDKALSELEKIARQVPDEKLGPTLLLEKGRLLDKMGRYDEAWAAFALGKKKAREAGGNSYNEEAAARLATWLKRFFTRSRMKILPRASLRTDVPQPIFVVGFPRSGTTMIEQTLGSHPAICAGDELVFVNDLTQLAPRMLNSPLHYPDALADLWLGDNFEALDNLRDFYLKRVQQLGFLREGARWFTDKMPLNETHLGLISMVFPHAPIVHLQRHPLDVMVSGFSNFFTHGFCCSFDLTTLARHYLLISDLVEHYRANLEMRYLPIRYESVVESQEKQVRLLLDFIGEPFDPRCLAFHENERYARTASYAQVTEKLYGSSVFRYRRYRKHLEPVIPMLEPAIRRMGYTVD